MSATCVCSGRGGQRGEEQGSQNGRLIGAGGEGTRVLNEDLANEERDTIRNRQGGNATPPSDDEDSDNNDQTNMQGEPLRCVSWLSKRLRVAAPVSVSALW